MPTYNQAFNHPTRTRMSTITSDLCISCRCTHDGPASYRLLHSDVAAHFAILLDFVLAERELGGEVDPLYPAMPVTLAVLL